MKKVLGILVATMMLLSSCVLFRGCAREGVNIYTEEKYTRNVRMEVQARSRIIELEHHGTVHEFVYYTDGYGYRSGLAHWPDCKYCKKEDNEQGQKETR